MTNPGILFVVSTPIGNLADITFRAVDCLRQVDWIAAEDTRHSAKLLAHFDISKPLLALHEHNEREALEKIAELIKNGQSVALISDAGTPLICDPGIRLVMRIIQEGFKIVPIPGVSAVITALSVSGLQTDQFIFIGFLPSKQQARIKQLSACASDIRTLICYEAPHRIVDCLQDIIHAMGPHRQVVLARELTKMHESIFRGSAQAAAEWLSARSENCLGEFVVLIAGASVAEIATREALAAREMLTLLRKEMSLSSAVKLVCKMTGVAKNTLYQDALDGEDSVADT